MIFIHLAKCAGTLINNYFKTYCPNYNGYVNPVKFARSGGESKEFTFTFLRDPHKWQVSYYHHLCQSPENKNNKLFRQEFPTFIDFMDYVDKVGGDRIDNRFCSTYGAQPYYLIDLWNIIKDKKIDYVGKVETINDNVKKIFDINGYDYNVTIDDYYKQNKKKSNPSIHDDYRTYYDDTIWEQVYTANLELYEFLN